jgi:PAS domain S-box-containing protein
MHEFPLSDEETRRVAALYELEILDTPAEKEYDHVVLLATQVCACTGAAITFLDIKRLWIKAIVGKIPDDIGTYITSSFNLCELTTPIQIEDTGLTMRSLTIFPLVNEDGFVLGHLSVANKEPGLLRPEQLSALEMLAMQTLSLLKLRLQLIKMKQLQTQSKYTLDRILPVFKNAIDAVIFVNKDDRICQWNPSAERMFGYTLEEATGQLFHHLLVPEHKHAIYWEARKTFSFTGEKDENVKFEFLAKTKDNRELIVAMGVTMAFIDGEYLYVCFIRDITLHRQAAKDLAKQKRFYENILNKIPMEIAVFDTDQRYLYVNPAGIKNASLREYIIGKTDTEYAAYRKWDGGQALLRQSQFMKVKSLRRTVTWEDGKTDPDGRLITYIRKLFPVYEEDELNLVIGYGMDITERKKLEMDQNVMVERLSFQNAQLFDFCNIVTHNLRGPLNNMAMLVNFIEDCKDSKEQKELVSKLKPVISRLNDTFNELVETIQVKQDLEIKSVNVVLEERLRRTLEGLEMEIREANAKITIDCSETPELYFPLKYVDSIFHNLLSNALKYRSPERRLHIKVSTAFVGNSIVLAVSDNGLGIDLKRYKNDVFGIGQVFHGHTNAKGLGLYMTKSQVEVMGGKIEVESEVNKGSTFRVEFKKQLSRVRAQV